MTEQEREALKGYLHAIGALVTAAFAMLEPDPDAPDRMIEATEDIEDGPPKVFGRKSG